MILKNVCFMIFIEFELWQLCYWLVKIFHTKAVWITKWNANKDEFTTINCIHPSWLCVDCKIFPTAWIDFQLFPNTRCPSINKYKYPSLPCTERYLGSLISSDTRLFSQLYFNKKLTCVISATHITIKP